MHVNLELCQKYNNLFVFLEFSRNCLVASKTCQAKHVAEPSFYVSFMNCLSAACIPPSDMNWLA